MVGIVVVSHSEPLAQAAVELALQMVGDDPPPIEVAAGNDGGLGTDAVAVAGAIQRADEAAAGSGVLVITDLGSALLSSEMALEFVDDLTGEVLLSRAPFVEGLVECRRTGRDGQVACRCRGRSGRGAGCEGCPARTRCGDGSRRGARAGADHKAGQPAAADSTVTLDVEVVNPQGLHARPAALLAKAAAKLPAEVSITNLETGQGPAEADSMLELMTIGVRQGNLVRLSAEGPDAMASLAELAALISSGLGEGTGAAEPTESPG